MKILDMLINWIVLIVKAVVFLFILPVYWSIPCNWGSKYIDHWRWGKPKRTAEDVHLNYTLIIKLTLWVLLWGVGPPFLLVYFTSYWEWSVFGLFTLTASACSMIPAFVGELE